MPERANWQSNQKSAIKEIGSEGKTKIANVLFRCQLNLKGTKTHKLQCTRPIECPNSKRKLVTKLRDFLQYNTIEMYRNFF